MADVKQEQISQVVLPAQLSSPEPELESLRPKSAFDQCFEKDGLQSPIVRAFTRNLMRKWRDRIAEKWELRMQEMKAERKKRSAESEEMTRLITRSVPIDLLAREWLDDNEITLDVRIYLIENLLPTLILGVEKLLLEVQKRGLADTEAFCPDFNPVNYLAQNLMRNNPKYSNFAEASPYAKGLRQVADDLKKEIFSIGDNKLAKLKEEANKKRMALEKAEQEKNREDLRRMMALEEQFPDWTADWNGVLPLAVVQNMLKSFEEYVSQLPEELRAGAAFLTPLEPTDSTDKMLNLKMYKEYLHPYAGNLSVGAFAEFMKHLGFCAKEYRLATVREAMRVVLKSLFMSCDTNNSGQLDRKRVLDLLVAFYDNAKLPVRASLMNPRKWPVREVEETTREEPERPSEGEVKAAGNDKGDNQEHTTVETEGEPKEEDKKDDDNASTQQTEEVVQDKVTEEGETNRATDDVKQEEENDGENLEEKEETKDEKKQDEVQEKEQELDAGGEAAKDTEDKAEEPEKHTQEMDDDQKLLDEIPDELESTEGTESSTLPRPRSVTEGSAFDENSLNQARFIQLIETFLGDVPVKSVFDQLSRFIRAGYVETNDELMLRMNKARMEALSAKRRRMIDQLYESWDVNASGYLEVEEIQVVLSKWRADNIDDFKEAAQVFGKVDNTLGRREFRQCIDDICKAYPEEDVFDQLIAFLTSSVERSFEERKRGDARKRWMALIDAAAQTSGAQLDPVYRAAFQVLLKDAEEHGKGKVVNASVCMLENNDDSDFLHRGDTLLRYVACTTDDIPYVLGKVLYRDMKTVSWVAVDSGKPIHVPKVATHSGVIMWNPLRKELFSDGSFIALPLKDHERRVIGLLGVDTMADPHKAVFITHEISFFQGVAKSVSQAIQFIDVRRKTLRVAESAVSWILRRSPNVQNVNVYLVEPGLKPSDGLVLRRMMTLGHGGASQHYSSPPRLDRKDNLFRDYLFKCVESSETITADAYGERHIAFPLRDAEGKAVAVVDISIGELRALPHHEDKEIQRMLNLLHQAHKEVAGEAAGFQKNIVLEVEKEYEDARIDVLFDRLMLMDLRENVGRLDARAFAEIKSYKDPPKVIHDILKAVLAIFYRGKEHQAKYSEWSTCRQYINQDLVKLITAYDPTARSNTMVDAKTLASTLQNVPQGQVAKHGSLPAQYLFNWAFVCLSLVEHTEKMAVSRPCKVVSPAKSEVVTDLGKNLPARPSPQDTSTRSEMTMD